jgi:tetratricopeptide (TPR) repeat protein
MVYGALLPQPLPQFGNDPWGVFRTNNAHVEFGGGFYHYGYNLQLAENTPNANTNSWELYFCSEGSPDQLLTHFALSPDACIPVATFVSNTLSEFSRRLAADPTSLDAHKGRIRFLLEYDRAQVRQACLDAIKALPEHWWPRLALALWESGRGRFAEASKAFNEFAAGKPSYSRYIYLAWFYQTMKRSDEAAAAVEKAVQYPIVDLDDDENNTECRGYSVGVFAYQSGKYGTVIKLCDVLLPIRENGDYAKSALTGLRKAAAAALNGKPENFRPDERILGFNPYRQMELDALLGH